jgi:hypothetical protein
VVVAGDKERVAGKHGSGVEEGDGVQALEHDMAGPLPADDLTEDAIRLVHRSFGVSAG